MLSLRKISDKFGQIPSMGYALVYLFAIPIFAMIYWKLPSSFYHSTVQYERVLNSDANAILQELRTEIIDVFNTYHKGDYAEEGNWKLNINEISLSSLKPEQEKTRFSLVLNLDGINDLEGAKLNILLRIYIENKLTYATQGPKDKWLTVVKRAEIENVSALTISPLLLFPYDINSEVPATEENRITWLPISEPLHNKVLGFSQTIKGFPVNASGSYSRMFYFSAVTITTLGYGDIVPITNVARITVAIQSIFGIVLIGLFLNSLAREQKMPNKSLRGVR